MPRDLWRAASASLAPSSNSGVAISLPNQCLKLLALLAAQPHNIRSLPKSPSQPSSPPPILAMAANHQILSNWLKRTAGTLASSGESRLHSALQLQELVALRKELRI